MTYLGAVRLSKRTLVGKDGVTSLAVLPAEFHMKRIDMFLKNVVACLLLSVLSAFAQNASIQELHGIAVHNIDRSMRPGDDFYRFANATGSSASRFRRTVRS
jgi:hypothetical protein